MGNHAQDARQGLWQRNDPFALGPASMPG